MGKAHARMLHRQGLTQRAKIALGTTDFEMHAIMHRSDHKNGRNGRAQRRSSARLHTHPTTRPACASRRALEALLRIGKCKCGAGEV